MGNVSILGNIFEDVAIKAPCLVATTANIVLSGVQSIDGVSVGSNGERVLVKNQTDKTTNGIYQASTGPWIRTYDASKNTDFVFGTLVTIAAGATQAGAQYVQDCTDVPVLLGTSLVTFVPLTNLVQAATSTTSTSSISVGTGTKAFTVAANLGFTAGQWILAWETSNPGNVMQGQVASYSGTTLTMNSVTSYGSGTHADWTIALTSSPSTVGIEVPGPAGPQGAPGVNGTAQNYDTVAAAAAATIPNTVNGVRTLGNLSPGDGGAAIYVHASGTTIGGFQSADGQWWQLAVQPLNDAMFGAVGDGVTNDLTALTNLLSRGAGLTVSIRDGKSYNLGTGSLTVADNTTVTCGRNTTIIRSLDPGAAGSWQTTYGSYTGAMISLGNKCTWSGGVFSNTAVLGTSGTANLVSSGTGVTKTFAVSAGLNIATGNFIRIWSRSSPWAHFEGTVNSYSGTTLVLNATFSGGSGTLSDWNITAASIYQAPMVLHGVTESIVEKVRIIGNWYVGILKDGWNPPAGGSLNVVDCILRSCWAEGVHNRAYYVYGTGSGNLIEGCDILGLQGTTDYGINVNPGNGTGAVNIQTELKIANVTIDGTGFQGIAISDQSTNIQLVACNASNLVNSSSAAFLVQQANNGVPQDITLVDCGASNCHGTALTFAGALYSEATAFRAIACNIGAEVTAQGGQASNYIRISGTFRASTTIGVWVTGSATDFTFNGDAIANGTNGIQIDAGCTNALLTGRTVANTSANIVDNGTGTVRSGLLTV